MKLEPKIKSLKFINTDRIVVNGTEFVRRNSFVTELEALINHVQVLIHGHHIHIKGNICFKCGKIFDRENMISLTKHHSIPAKFKPKYNVFIPVCIKCQEKIHNKKKIKVV